MKVSIDLDEDYLRHVPLASLRKHVELVSRVLEEREAKALAKRQQRDANAHKRRWYKVKSRKYFLQDGLVMAEWYMQHELARMPLSERDPVTERFLDSPVRYTQGTNSFCTAEELLDLREYDAMIGTFEAKHGVVARVYSVKGDEFGIYTEDRAALRVDLMPQLSPDIDTALATMEPLTYTDLRLRQDRWVGLAIGRPVEEPEVEVEPKSVRRVHRGL